jgi:hypothetical protein
MGANLHHPWILSVARACGLAAVTVGPRLNASVVLPMGLAPGAQYRLAFVTTHPDPLGLAYHPEAHQFGWYANGFVTQEASLSASLPGGLTWNLCAGGQNGFAHAIGPQDASAVPVYDTSGHLLLPAADQNGPNTIDKAAALLVGAGSPSSTRVLYDQNGNAASNDSWFTNLNKVGPNFGGPGPSDDPNRVILSWNSDPAGPPGSNISEGATTFPLPYAAQPGLADLALSSVITVPEPASLSAGGIIGLCATLRIRRRRTAV